MSGRESGTGRQRSRETGIAVKAAPWTRQRVPRRRPEIRRTSRTCSTSTAYAVNGIERTKVMIGISIQSERRAKVRKMAPAMGEDVRDAERSRWRDHRETK
jgi:hypothetical protein